MADLEEAAKTCQRGAAGEAPQNHVLAAGQRTAGTEAVTRGLPCRGGSSCPAGTTGKEENSSCGRMGNQLGTEELVLSL